MSDGIRWVGLDMHARESTFAVFDQATGEVRTKRVVGRSKYVVAYQEKQSPFDASPTLSLRSDLFHVPALMRG